MPRYTKRRRTWKSYLRIWTVPALAVACVVGLVCQEISFRHQQKTSWTTVTAQIAETRLHPVAHYALEYGGRELYEIDVRVDLRVRGAQQDEWVPLSAAPTSLAEAQSKAAALHGAKCLVRWDPGYPEQKIADLP